MGQGRYLGTPEFHDKNTPVKDRRVMKESFGKRFSANTSQFHQIFQTVLVPLGHGVFFLTVFGLAVCTGWVTWSDSLKDWWLIPRLIASVLAGLLGGVGGILSGWIILAAGALATAILGYSTCLIIAAVQWAHFRFQASERKRKELAAAWAELVRSYFAKEQWVWEQGQRSKLRNVRVREDKPTEFRRQAAQLKLLIKRIGRELELIEAKPREQREFTNLRTVIEAEMNHALEKHEWDHLAETIRAARDELRAYMHVDRGLMELGIKWDNFTRSAVKKSYFDHAKMYHPDSGGNPDPDRMTRINWAREILERYLNAHINQATA